VADYNIDVPVYFYEVGSSDVALTRWYPLILAYQGTAYSSVESLLNGLASDQQMIRVTGIDLQLRFLSAAGYWSQMPLVTVGILVANGSIDNGGNSTSAIYTGAEALNQLLVTNSRKGMVLKELVQMAAPIPPIQEVGGTAYPAASCRFRIRWKVSSKIAGKIMSDDEGMADAGYRTYFGAAVSRCNATSTARDFCLMGHLQLRCVRKDFQNQPITLEDLLAEAD
jgi:hypothetical protein